MNATLGALDVDRFLRDHWQRAPCLIRGAFPDFDPPLDGDDLAGLACEPLVEARLVEGPAEDGSWTLRHGPFEEGDFESLGDRDWTLLVQDVEKHYPPLRPLLDRFRFLPSWRLDDLMVSFAAPGGSVGPHVDQYDVFLLQGAGRRRWAIAESFDSAPRPDTPLDMLARFEAEREWVLEPGDMLYLPPGVAHHGVALDPCLTWSVGFRAPSAADLAMALGEWLAREPDDGGRYRDPPLTPAYAPGEIEPEALERFRDLLKARIDDPAQMDRFVAAFLSRFRQAHEPVPGPAAPGARELDAHLAAGGALETHPWARMNWVRRGEDALLYASGRPYTCSPEFAAWLCAGAGAAPPLAGEDRDRRALSALVGDGQLILSGSD